MDDEDFCNNIAVADYLLFRNKNTYLKDEESLYHLCDGTLLNLYISKMNKF